MIAWRTKRIDGRTDGRTSERTSELRKEESKEETNRRTKEETNERTNKNNIQSIKISYHRRCYLWYCVEILWRNHIHTTQVCFCSMHSLDKWPILRDIHWYLKNKWNSLSLTNIAWKTSSLLTKKENWWRFGKTNEICRSMLPMLWSVRIDWQIQNV